MKDYEGSRERRDQGERGDRRNFSLTQMSDKGIVAARRGGRHRAKRRSDIDLFLSWRERDIYIYKERERRRLHSLLSSIISYRAFSLFVLGSRIDA